MCTCIDKMHGELILSSEAKVVLSENDPHKEPSFEPKTSADSTAALKVPVSPKKALEPEMHSQPPRRSRSARNRFVVFFNFLISSTVLMLLIAGAVIYFGKQRFMEPGPLEVSKSIVVKEGSSLASIAGQLMSGGIIDNDFIFRRGVQAYRAQKEMKPGEYAFKPAMSMHDVMQTLRSGKGIIYKISIPEGLTVFQIFERIDKNDVLVGGLPNELPVEGSLMPDTYPFQRGQSRQELVNQMMRAQKKILTDIWSKRVAGLPISTPQEMLILASIVEKETGQANERPHVASVFVNRLNKGMKLQSDPTIIYGIYGGKGKPKNEPIFRSELDKVTKYNTYQIPALPPGPISNPGRAALEAVANPSRTNDLYFVADGTGGHAFAETLAEHNANVQRWRVIEKRMKAQKLNSASGSQDSSGAQSN